MRPRSFSPTLVATLLLLFTPAIAHAAVIERYVDHNSADEGPGTAWDSAWHSLQSALAEARNDHLNGYVIYVANGVYRLTSTTASFSLVADCTLLGGFAGYGEANPNARDITLTPSILSGDVAHNYSASNPFAPASIADNARHVVIAAPYDVGIFAQTIGFETVLDGFTILSGNGLNETVDLPDDPDVAACGTYEGCNPDPVPICSCYTDSDACSTDHAKPGKEGGGGMQCFHSSPTIRNCTFRHNQSAQGGGLRVVCESNPRIINCDFIENRAIPVPDPPEGSTANGSGGGLYVVAHSSPDVVNCRFIGNFAAHVGGGCAVQFICAPNFMNCLFYLNSAADYGGGMRAGVDTGPFVINCTFYANEVVDGGEIDQNSGGGFSSGGDENGTPPRSMALQNCIFWGNTLQTPLTGGLGEQISLDGPSTEGQQLMVDSCLVQDGELGVFDNYGELLVWGAGNTEEDPEFQSVDPQDEFFLHPGLGSPAVDSGDDDFVLADVADLDTDTDLGEPTPQDLAQRCRIWQTVDMGAFENNQCREDIDSDGDVDGADLGILLGAYGLCSGACPADLNCDGKVDSADLALLFGAWGECEQGENQSAMMASNSSEESGSVTPSELAANMGFASIDELVAWLDGLDFEAMEGWLTLMFGS